MSKNDSYIKIPSGSTIEIRDGDDKEKKVQKDLANTSSTTNHNNKEANETDSKSNNTYSESHSKSSVDTHRTETTISSSDTLTKNEDIIHDKDSNYNPKSINDSSDEVVQTESKNTLKVKIKNIFKFK